MDFHGTDVCEDIHLAAQFQKARFAALLATEVIPRRSADRS